MVQDFQLSKYPALDLNATQDDQATQTTPTETVDFTTLEVLDAEILVPATDSQEY
jgi:hypothetical protein